jgi:hypothetical protein
VILQSFLPIHHSAVVPLVNNRLVSFARQVIQSIRKMVLAIQSVAMVWWWALNSVTMAMQWTITRTGALIAQWIQAGRALLSAPTTFAHVCFLHLIDTYSTCFFYFFLFLFFYYFYFFILFFFSIM